MARVLLEYRVNVTFTELAGKPHWWWDTKKDSDGGAMNDAELRSFYALLNAPLPPFPAQLDLVTYNPSTHGGRGGVRVMQQLQPYRRTHVRISRSLYRLPNGSEVPVLKIVTVNVRRMAFCDAFRRWGWGADDPSASQQAHQPLLRLLVLDANGRGGTHGGEGGGTLFERAVVSALSAGGCGMSGGDEGGAGGGSVTPLPASTVVIKAGTWVFEQDTHWIVAERSPANYGPARQVIAKPFLIILGTQGPLADVQRLLEAGIFLSTGHAMASETVAPLVNDTALTPALEESHNLVVLGGPRHNTIAARLAAAIRERAKATVEPTHEPLCSPSSPATCPSAVSSQPAVEFFDVPAATDAWDRDHSSNSSYSTAGPWISVGGCRLTSSEEAAVFTYPRHLSTNPKKALGSDGGGAREAGRGAGAGGGGQVRAPRLDLFVVAGSVTAIEVALRYSFSVQQALTRAPHSNMVPDFFVTGPEYQWKGYGGLQAAGFWGNNWEFRHELAYSTCAH